MKKKNFNKRLSLNKSVISNLNLKDAKGGVQLELIRTQHLICNPTVICRRETMPCVIIERPTLTITITTTGPTTNPPTTGPNTTGPLVTRF